MAKLIRERFSKPADEFAARFVASVEADERLVPHDVRGSIAHARMLRRQGLLSEADAAAIEEGLSRILREWEEGSFRLDVAYEDVHMNVEKRLTDLAGPAGARLHTARSRNDQVAADLRLWMREATREILEGLGALRRALARRALEHAGTILPGVTHLQRAQPVTFGHVLLCYHDRLARDAGRFEDALRRMDVSPLGACALAGTSLPIDPAFTARELGFSRAFENSIDAVSDRDFAVEFVAAAALLAAHLSQMAEDFIVWSAPEFGFIELPDELCTSSSIMPQKKNPDMVELVRGKAAGVAGRLVSLLGTLKGLASGYNRDLQETKPPVFDAAETVRLSLRAMLLAVEGLKADAARMRRAAEDPQILATDLAEYLAARGVPFREAHGAVARLMKHCADRGASPAGMPLAELREFSAAFGEDVYARLTPEASVASKKSPGGTAPALVAARAERLLGEPAP
jgi:argininosuccinate lyase